MIFGKNRKIEAIDYLNSLLDKGKKVKIDWIKPLRSNSENRYMHGVVFSIFAIHLGWTLDEAKQYFKKTFLSYEKDGVKFVKETKKLNVQEMEIFLECCRVHAVKEHDCYIPVPNEVTQEMLEEIYKHEKYLK